jgi:hypothetical protein
MIGTSIYVRCNDLFVIVCNNFVYEHLSFDTRGNLLAMVMLCSYIGCAQAVGLGIIITEARIQFQGSLYGTFVGEIMDSRQGFLRDFRFSSTSYHLTSAPYLTYYKGLRNRPISHHGSKNYLSYF